MSLKNHEAIDCHAHIGAFKGYDLSLGNLLQNLGTQDIKLALVSNIDAASIPGKTEDLDESTANRETVSVVREHCSILRGLFWAKPLGGSPELLAELAAETVPSRGWTRRAIVGVKLHPEMNQYRADIGALDPYMELCHMHRLPVVVHCDAVIPDASAERIEALGKRHPQVPIVLYHMGFNGSHEAAIQAVERSVLEGKSKLYLETAQADPESVIDAIGRVGIERVLFGTDATYYGENHYDAYAGLISMLERTLSASELTRIFSQNSVELFGLVD